MKRLYIATAMMLLLAAPGSAAAENGEDPAPRIWIEIESSEGGISRLELIDIVEGRFVLKTLEGLKFDLEQDEVVKVKVVAVGEKRPWEEQSHEPSRRAPASELPLPAPPPGLKLPDENVRRSIKSLRLTPAMMLYISGMQRRGRLEDAEKRLLENVERAPSIDAAMGNAGGLLNIWVLKKTPPGELQRKLLAVVISIRDDDVRQGATDVLRYFKEHNEAMEEISRRMERMRDERGEPRRGRGRRTGQDDRFRRPESDNRPRWRPPPPEEDDR